MRKHFISKNVSLVYT